MLTAVADVLITIANGLITITGRVLDLTSLLIIISAVCLAWLAAVEIEMLDRRAYKPSVRPH